MDESILMMLLRGQHVSMELRVTRGLWPHDPLRLEDLVTNVVRALEQERWFPCEWQPAQAGASVREGGTIEREGPGRYVYRRQRHHPINPTVLAASTEQVFSSAAAAARHYLRWELNLPGDLDGYEVIE